MVHLQKRGGETRAKQEVVGSSAKEGMCLCSYITVGTTFIGPSSRPRHSRAGGGCAHRQVLIVSSEGVLHAPADLDE